MDVYFDDLKIDHTYGDIVAGGDYYAFGMPMENRTITKRDYRYGYQGQFAEKDEETGWNSFEARMYDSRIGRWMAVDPARQFASPYVGMGNSPLMRIDPDGRWTERGAKTRAFFTPGVKVSDVYESGGEYGFNSSVNGAGIQFNYGKQEQAFKDFGKDIATDLWNSPPARALVPDFASIGVEYGGNGFIGGSTSFQLTWVTRGNKSSIYPVLSTTQVITGGVPGAGATLNVGGGSYLGPVRDIIRGMIQTRIVDGQYTVHGSFALRGGVNLGVGFAATQQSTGNFIVDRSVQIGVGLGPGVRADGGVSNTFILKDFR